MLTRKVGGWLALAAGAVCLLTLSGCTVPVDGITGISVNGKGNWVVVLAWSCRRPDEVVIYHDSRNGLSPDVTDAVIDAPTTELGILTPAASPVGIMTVDVVHPPADWTVRHAAKPLDPSVTYWAYGATRDNSWATGHMEFRLSDIDRLPPGQVLYANQNGKVVGSMDQFEKAATTTC